MSWTFPHTEIKRDEQVVRPRLTRYPPYLEDYSVDYYPSSSYHQQCYEGPARMTPLSAFGDEGGKRRNVPITRARDKDEVLDAIQEIRKENMQLQENMLRLTKVVNKLVATASNILQNTSHSKSSFISSERQT